MKGQQHTNEEWRYRTVASRAWTDQTFKHYPKEKATPRPEHLMVLDTEATLDPTQRLTFGYCLVYQRKAGRKGHGRSDWKPLRAFLFHHDDATPEEVAILAAYRDAHWYADGARLQVLSRREFVNKHFYYWAYTQRALVVGYNLPFDLSRLATGWGEARKVHAGGFSLRLFDNAGRARLAVKSIDSRRQMMAFTAPMKTAEGDRIPEGSEDGTPDKTYVFPGHFLDLHMAAFGLTNRNLSLARACDAFGVEHGKDDYAPTGRITVEEIDYCRHDVRATFELACKVFAAYDQHPISPDSDHPAAQGLLTITKVYSPASIAKAYLQAMGIEPPLQRWPDFPKERLGQAMEAYFGGRAEGHIRLCAVSCVYCDFMSMYTTINVLLGLGELLTAERVHVVDATQEVQELLETVTLDDCFSPSFWRRLVGFAAVYPDGDHLPTRANYSDGPSYEIGVNPFSDRKPVWYALPDLVAAKLRTGKAPRVVEAWQLVPEGRQKGLQPVMLQGTVPIDANREDFFRKVIEERAKVKAAAPPYADLPETQRQVLSEFLKVLANAGSYGVLAEMNPKSQRQEVTVHTGSETYRSVVQRPEEPGVFAFPPIAALITSGARLMLTLLERAVTDLGGTYAFCDTDSMAIIATERGGAFAIRGQGADGRPCASEVRALSYDQVRDIQGRFRSLSPYDPNVVRDILKIEDVNYDPRTGRQRELWAYVISAKRYCLFTWRNDEPEIVDWKEHGLGHLLDPLRGADADDEDRDEEAEENDGRKREWTRQVWEYLLRHELGLSATLPEWADRPALSRITASSVAMLAPFGAMNEGKPYAEQVKPFNFLLLAHVIRFGHPPGVEPTRFSLTGPYETNSGRWTQMEWIDRYSGKSYRIRTQPPAADDPVAGLDLNTLTTEEFLALLDATYPVERSRMAATSVIEVDQAVEGVVTVRSYADVIEAYATHPEAKACGADGLPCSRLTMGLLQPRPVIAALHACIGKEGNRIDEVAMGLIHDVDEVLTVYERHWEDAPFFLRRMPVSVATQLTALSARTISSIRSGTRPHRSTRAQIARSLADWLRPKLVARGYPGSLPVPETMGLARSLLEPVLQALDECGRELAALRSEQNSDPHRAFRWLHDLSECFSLSNVRTRYHDLTLRRPRGKKSGHAALRAVEGLVDGVCAELGEDYETFCRKTCESVHGRERQIEVLTAKRRMPVGEEKGT